MDSKFDRYVSIKGRFEPLLKDLDIEDLSMLNKLVVDHINAFRQRETLLTMAEYRIGERVYWITRDGVEMSGVIIRLNAKTVSVQVSKDGFWNVSPQLLYRAEDPRK